MLSEAEMRIIAGIIAAIEVGTLGQMAYVYLYKLVKSRNIDTFGGF